MNNKFKSFYQLADDELSKIWSSEETIFVFDTNVLLNLYQYSSETQDVFFKTLVTIQNRVWIPFHVALEYQRRRLDVIRNEKSIPRDMLKKINEIEDIIEKQFSFSNFKLKIRNSSLFDKEQKLQKNITSLINSFKEEVEKVDRKQPCVRSLDVIRNKLDEILETKIGDDPEQSWLDDLYTEGQERYGKNIPPGYADESKGKDTDNASFTFDGVCYERKFGDLIIWKQIIDYVKDKESVKNVVFITDDSKEDWWEIVDSNGKKNIGARQELKTEIYREGKIEYFKMYRTNDFLSDARNYLSIEIDDKAIEEAKEHLYYSTSSFLDKINKYKSSLSSLDEYRYLLNTSDTNNATQKFFAALNDSQSAIDTRSSAQKLSEALNASQNAIDTRSSAQKLLDALNASQNAVDKKKPDADD